MTTNEKKILAVGIAVGVLATGISIAVLTGRGTYASEKSAPAATHSAAEQPTADQSTQPGTTLQLSPSEITAAGVQIAEVRTAALTTGIASFGRVEQPEAQLAAISARIGGRVDKLYVQYTGETVRRGQPIADVYSPEVATALADYRLSQETRTQLNHSDSPEARTQADALVTASQRKLQLWGINEKQIDAPESTGIPHITLYASASGSVVERKVTQGQYVNAGDTLFTVADLSTVWIKADVYEDQLAQIRRGQQVDITTDALPNRTLHGHVDFIEPNVSPQTRTAPVHIHVANPGMRLLPGMFVNATFTTRAATESIVVPRSAVLDTGTRKLVYVAKPNGVFEAREVALGTPSDDLFPVLHGLSRGDKVVLAGNFLIDSQAHLSSGMSGLYGGSKEFSANESASGTSAPAQAKLTLDSNNSTLKTSEDNIFTATLTSPDGKPITDAQIKVSIVMPAMPSMNMPEMRSTVDLAWNAAQHAYIGKGRPGMAGSWTITAEATRNGAVIATSRTRMTAQ